MIQRSKNINEFLSMLMASAAALTPMTQTADYIPFTGNGSNGSYSYTKGSAKRQQRQSRRKRNIRLHPHSTAQR